MGELVRIEAWKANAATETPPTDGELLYAARAGSTSAHEVLFRRHYPRILQLAYRLLGREDDAEDLAQDVCVEALRGLSRVRDPDAFASWLTRICVFRARSRIRHYVVLRRLRLTGERIVDPDCVVSSNISPELGVDLRRLYRHIQALPVDQRIALVLRRVEGLEINEIAAHMGRSAATVKRRIAEAETTLDRLTGGNT